MNASASASMCSMWWPLVEALLVFKCHKSASIQWTLMPKSLFFVPFLWLLLLLCGLELGAAGAANLLQFNIPIHKRAGCHADFAPFVAH